MEVHGVHILTEDIPTECVCGLIGSKICCTVNGDTVFHILTDIYEVSSYGLIDIKLFCTLNGDMQCSHTV